MKISIKDIFSKCDQNLKKLRIGSHLLKKSLMENFNFCAVYVLPLQITQENWVTLRWVTYVSVHSF